MILQVGHRNFIRVIKIEPQIFPKLVKNWQRPRLSAANPQITSAKVTGFGW